jgi:hypothetical protein
MCEQHCVERNRQFNLPALQNLITSCRVQLYRNGENPDSPDGYVLLEPRAFINLSASTIIPTNMWYSSKAPKNAPEAAQRSPLEKESIMCDAWKLELA